MNRKRVVLLTIALACTPFIVRHAGTQAERGLAEPKPFRSEMDDMIDRNRKAGRVPWYPFKREPAAGFRFPVGDVVMTGDEATRRFLDQFSPYVHEALEDPDTLPYLVGTARFFREMTHRHHPVRIVASARYGPSVTVPASIFSSEFPDQAIVKLYMPFWAEVDAWIEPEAARDDFLITLSHEFEHFEEGFWRAERDHSHAENVRTEALVWARTCERAILPLMGRGRWVSPHVMKTCEVYADNGRDAAHPAFLAFTETHNASH